jgi:hypothetical protein
MITKARLYAYILTTDKSGRANLLDAVMTEELKARVLALQTEYPDQLEKQL